MLQVAQVAAYKLNCPPEMIAINTNPNSKYNNDQLTLNPVRPHLNLKKTPRHSPYFLKMSVNEEDLS